MEPLPPHQPIIHVNWYEPQAYCWWAEHRLSTEAEWEMAASVEASPDGSTITSRKLLYPWGDEPPSLRHANLDGRLLGPADVAAFPEGDSAFGLRQMVGTPGVVRRYLRALPRLRFRPVRGLLRALVRRPQGLARWLLGHARPHAPQHLAQLLHAGSTSRVRGIQDMRRLDVRMLSW